MLWKYITITMQEKQLKWFAETNKQGISMKMLKKTKYNNDITGKLEQNESKLCV